MNASRAGVPHRVTLTRGQGWTLLLHGPRECAWVVTDDAGKTLEVSPWSGIENPGRTGYAI